MEDIKACPFCGVQDCLSMTVTTTITGNRKNDEAYEIHCFKCGNFTHFCEADSKEQLIKKWNKRTTPNTL